MLKIKRILWPTDFSRCAQQAFGHAVHLAREHNAELHVLHALVLLQDDSHHLPNKEEINQQIKALASGRMTEALGALAAGDIKIKQAHVRGISTAPAILDYAKENDIDLIVMGTHGRRGLGHLFLGSVAEEAVRHAVCPVLTIREQQEPMPVDTMHRILVPVDFSAYSERALIHAKEIAASFDARLQVLHIIEEFIPPTFYMSTGAAAVTFSPELKAKTKEALLELLQDTDGPEVQADFYVLEGNAAHDIVDFAKEKKSDLIVIATHGRTGLEHLLMGSVTEKVVRRAPCPVFTVRTFGKSLV